jgi:hypothetical protein
MFNQFRVAISERFVRLWGEREFDFPRKWLTVHETSPSLGIQSEFVITSPKKMPALQTSQIIWRYPVEITLFVINPEVSLPTLP